MVKAHSTAEQEAVATWPVRPTQLISYSSFEYRRFHRPRLMIRIGVLRSGQVATASCSAVECHCLSGSLSAN